MMNGAEIGFSMILVSRSWSFPSCPVPLPSGMIPRFSSVEATHQSIDESSIFTTVFVPN